MKKKKMSDIMSLVNDEYITEADPSPRAPKRQGRFKLSTIISCACCLLLLLNLVIFVPFLTANDDPVIPSGDSTNQSLNHAQTPPNEDGDTSSDKIAIPSYRNEEIIQVLDKYFDRYDNISDSLVSPDGSTDDEAWDQMEETSKNESAESGSIQDSLEDLNDKLDGSVSTDINDNQVSGISEGDIIKRSDKHIFYLSRTELSIYSIDKNKSRLVCRLPLDNYIKEVLGFTSESLSAGKSAIEELEDVTEQEELKDVLDDIYEVNTPSNNISLSNYANLAYSFGWEMYLSSDYKTLTIIAVPAKAMVTAVFSFDVSELPTVTMTDYNIFSGSYLSSRMVNDELLLFTRYAVKRSYNKDNPMSYMPFYTEDGRVVICDIYYPDKITTTTYMTISRVNAKSLDTKESISFLSYSSNIYVSKDNIYLTRPYYDSGYQMTEITRVEYSTGAFVPGGNTAKVVGYIKDQYSLDEYDGILRVTTTVTAKYGEDNKLYRSSKSASLFCIDIRSMETAAMVQCFAPSGEIVRSVRYDGYEAYVCTSYEVVFFDPVFVFDLSNLDNITYRDTGTIDGYSSSLINLGKGYLLGIGFGEDSSTLKIEVYAYDDTKNYLSRISSLGTIPNVPLISDNASREEKAEWIKNILGDDFDTERYTDDDLDIVIYFTQCALGMDLIEDIGATERAKEIQRELGGVYSVAKYERDRTNFSSEYKSYYIDRSRALIGLAVRSGGVDRYLLLRFNGQSFDTVVLDEVDCSYMGETRGFYDDGYCYIVTSNDFKAIDVGVIAKIDL